MVLRIALALVVMLGLVGPALAQTVTLKLATIVGNDNPFTTSAYKFKEIAEAKANIRTALENAIKQEGGRQSAAIADRLATASLSNSVMLSPESNLALYNALDPTLTADAVSEAFRAAWAGGPTLIHVATKAPIEGGDAVVASFNGKGTRGIVRDLKISLTVLQHRAPYFFSVSEPQDGIGIEFDLRAVG